ncbi:SDR family NAD(P)-dependent oxidoreductase [Iodidimonas sp. SYSU 1G8]|uniref:SDR family NAD(P)-dependent oxidoreductase n=1 Tax=Iodidimonas sp. SYSU 1G8 TaxID=3133967 RepID=UPI0031FEBD92
MELGLKDKVVFIAGASRGIGRAMAEAFAREGARVAITGRTEDSLEEARAALSANIGKDSVAAITGDMTQSSDIARALDRTEAKLGPIHCAIANVGIGRAPLGIEVGDDDWNADIAQNLTGSMFLARDAIKRMLKRPADARDGANVIMISSIAGVDAMGTAIPYAATKAAINHAATAMAKLVGKDGIRVNAIAPGNILFPGGSWEKITASRPDAWQRWIDREVALKRFGKVEEIADAALWLASDRASFVTGATIVVDGGQVR